MKCVCIKKNGQCSINIPKELIAACQWKEKDVLVISKMQGKTDLLVENITRGDIMGESISARLKNLEQENKELKKTVELLKDTALMKKLSKAYEEHKQGKGHTEKEVFGHLG